MKPKYYAHDTTTKENFTFRTAVALAAHVGTKTAAMSYWLQYHNGCGLYKSQWLITRCRDTLDRLLVQGITRPDSVTYTVTHDQSGVAATFGSLQDIYDRYAGARPGTATCGYKQLRIQLGYKGYTICRTGNSVRGKRVQVLQNGTVTTYRNASVACSAVGINKGTGNLILRSGRASSCGIRMRLETDTPWGITPSEVSGKYANRYTYVATRDDVTSPVMRTLTEMAKYIGVTSTTIRNCAIGEYPTKQGWVITRTAVEE